MSRSDKAAPSRSRGSDFAGKGRGAFVGAAIGDALGWPQERRSSRVGGTKDVVPTLELTPWLRRTGTRFKFFVEPIEAGSYSDDTQLLWATARALQYGPEWWGRWTSVELPFWVVYERGGGAAIKRAAKDWLEGRPPWLRRMKADREKYFAAGANGVAMRIIPHSLVRASSRSFDQLALDVLANGITTHGHPRALVGALAYAFAAWTAFKHTGSLGFGELATAVLDSRDEWATLPPPRGVLQDWYDEADRFTRGGYREEWDRVGREMADMLVAVLRGMDRGALAIDHEVLEMLGCFDQRVNGSGTTAAAAAIFLASRYAVDPPIALLQGAFARGADTDTLASMSAALLGALAGDDWLARVDTRVQDIEGILGVAEATSHLAQPSRTRFEPQRMRDMSVANLKRFREHVFHLERGEAVRLPDGRAARLLELQRLSADGAARPGRRARLETEDGQNLFLAQMLEPGTAAASPATSGAGADVDPQLDLLTPSDDAAVVTLPSPNPVRARALAMLPVRDPVASKKFYGEVLGLPGGGSGSGRLVFAGSLILVPVDGDAATIGSNVIYVDTSAFAEVLVRLRDAGVAYSDSKTGGKRRMVTCQDPDGNVVHVAAY